MSALILRVGDVFLDTNCGIALLGSSSIADEFYSHGRAYLPSVAVGELIFGAYNSSRRERNLAKIEELLLHIPVVDCTVETAHWYGLIRHQLKSIGKQIPSNDIWIAALAKQHGLTLATKDHHFDYIEGLECVDW